MRKAAGIMLIIVGMAALVVEIIVLNTFGSHFFPYSLFPMVLGGLVVTGGVLCIKKRYWGLCLASALIAVFIAIRLLIGGYRLPWEWVFPVLGILAIIFVCITRKEWKKI